MEPKFQTSFIPKKPVGSSLVSDVETIQNTNVFSIAAGVIFIVTAIVAGGLFFYKDMLEKQIAQDDTSITEARAAFEPEKIQELLDANARIISVKSLLEKHVVVSKVLSLMQELTVKKMRFTQLDYSNKANDPTINITGEIQTYNALAGQQNIFLANEFLKGPTFTNFNLADSGYIQVNFTSKIDPNLVSYNKKLESIPLN
jgi:hypothetical protein